MRGISTSGHYVVPRDRDRFVGLELFVMFAAPALQPNAVRHEART